MLTVGAQTVSGTLTTLNDADGLANKDVDTFQYPATARFLPEGAVVSL